MTGPAGLTGTAGQLPRLLALVPYLLSRPGVRLAEVATTFGISEERLRRDLNLLWVCGLPGHGPGDLIDIEFEGDTITLSEPAGVTRPLRLTVDEALALIVALRALADTPGLSERDAVDRALAKVEQAAGAAAGAAARVEVSVEGEQRVLPVVRAALEDRRRLHLSYHVPGRDETTERDVDPMRVLMVDGRWYLEGWCHRAEGVRLFRLDRIESLDVLDVAADVPATAVLRDLDEGLFRSSPEHTLVTLELDASAAWVTDYYPVESVEDLPGERLLVRLRVGDDRWLRTLVLRLGGAAAVLDPPELVEAVRSRAESALAAYVRS